MYLQMSKISLVLLNLYILISYVNCEAEDEAVLTKVLGIDNFNEEVTKTNPHFIMFYAPWCGHCKRLHPIWDELAAKYTGEEESSITIAKVDCTKEASVCKDHGVNGYPTLKLFNNGPEEGVKYSGQRKAEDFEKFIALELGLVVEEEEVKPPKAVSGLVEFTDESFQESVKKGNLFVKFYAPWCGHCQRLIPTWKLLAESLEHDSSVIVGKLDCTQHKSICNEFEVKGYPTLLWFKDGKKVAKYSGNRSDEDLKRFVSEQLGGDKSEDAVVKKEETDSTVVALTIENFENAIGTGLTFVKFYAPWCGHCKRLAPIFQELGNKFVAVDAVTIAKVDCTQQDNKKLCNEQKVNGFPSLMLYKDGEKILTYSGDRSLEDMFDVINNKLDHDEL